VIFADPADVMTRAPPRGNTPTMFVLISPAGPSRARAAVQEPQDLSKLHVELRDVTEAAAREALAAAGLGQVDGEHAWLSVKALRSAAKGGTGSDWSRRFDAMLDAAQRQGHADEKLTRVRALIVRT
jgi:hypothetical protein